MFSVVENEAKGGIMWDATFEICDHEVRPTRKLAKSEFEEILPNDIVFKCDLQKYYIWAREPLNRVCVCRLITTPFLDD